MYTWVSRLKSKMEELNLNQDELARKLGITRGAIAHYLAGRRVPPLSQFQKLAVVLQVDPAWLQFGTTPTTMIEKKNKKEEAAHFQIPILSWQQAKEFTNLTKLGSLKVQDWIPNLFIDTRYRYALRITNDSMTQAGHKKSFYEGDLIIIESAKIPTNGDFVIALTTKDSEPSFRQYVVDAGITYLKPLNPQYPLLTINKKTNIIGVMVALIRVF